METRPRPWNEPSPVMGGNPMADSVSWCSPARPAGPSPNSLTRWFADHVDHMDGLVPRTTLHQLRHSFGSVLLAAGVPLGDVARRLGHSQQVSEKVYAKELAVLRDESRAVVLDAIEKLWGNGQS